MDPIRNPYAPGAGQPPPELAGREEQLRQFEVHRARAVAGRPVRGTMLIGLRGVGKTVLLQQMRTQARLDGWATGRIEARPGIPLGGQVAAALEDAVTEISDRARHAARLRRLRAVLRAFSLTVGALGSGVRLDVDPAPGRADSGDFERDLTAVLIDAADYAADEGTGVALFVDEAQDIPLDGLAALCGACHEISQTSRPLLLIGAGLPPLPTRLAEARSYAERLFNYVEVDRLRPAAAVQALVEPARREQVLFEPDALAALVALADGYAYFLQAYGKATWDAAPASPITAADVHAGREVAERDLAVGFFGARYHRAGGPARAFMMAMAELGDGPVSSSAVARRLGRPLKNVSFVREELLAKGLLYSPERGLVAFTVPHMAQFLRGLADEPTLTEPAAARRG